MKLNLNFLWITAAIAISSASLERLDIAQSTTPLTPAQTAIRTYNADPAHLWNRLHRILWTRQDSDGKLSGEDRPDPLLWLNSKHLTDGPSYDEAMKLLAEFAAASDPAMLPDPLHRAMMRRELWSVLDWSADPWRRPGNEAERKRIAALQRALVKAMDRIPLTAEEISFLPDNYASAVASNAFATDFDAAHPEKPFLPPDLFDKTGPWICVGELFPLNTPRHVHDFGGRSAFLVFLRLPGSRTATLEYLDALRGGAPQGMTQDLHRMFESQLPEPRQVPEGTAAALVRRMLAPDDKGNLLPTPITEMVQFRVFRGTAERVAPIDTQYTYEFELRLSQLFEKQTGGLHVRPYNERDFQNVQLQSMGTDEFEAAAGQAKPITLPARSILQSCMGCHSSRPGEFLNSLRPGTTRRQIFGGSTDRGLEREARDLGQVIEGTMRWKRDQFSWGLLQGLRNSEK